MHGLAPARQSALRHGGRGADHERPSNPIGAIIFGCGFMRREIEFAYAPRDQLTIDELHSHIIL